MPTVSILVPIYGVEKYIEQCAETLFQQSFADIEYVFVNDRKLAKSNYNMLDFQVDVRF